MIDNLRIIRACLRAPGIPPSERTLDILMSLSAQRRHQRLVGFAGETDHLIEYGQAKLTNKHLDMLVVNHIGGEQSAFGNDTNEVYVLTPGAAPDQIPRMPRWLADTLLDRTLSLPVQPSPQRLGFLHTS